MSSKVAGVDDAGRGSIIGPLVIAGVAIAVDKLAQLSNVGVRDSKLLSPFARRRLYKQINEVADKVVVAKLEPSEVDRYVFKRKKYEKLNYLEALTAARVIDQLDADRIYVDASDTDVERFRKNISDILKKKVEIISAHHADRKFIVVSAASIVAKVIRDDEIEGLKRLYGDFGSGYPADPRTRAFLKEWLKSHGEPPLFSRRSWKTWKKLVATRLDDSMTNRG